MTVDYRIGDTRDVLAAIPDGSVDLVASSPPFLALRSYLPADHESKHAEIGSEPDPATFIDTLLALTADWGRVLAPHGSIAIELGDTYSGSGGAGGDYNEKGLREGQRAFKGSATVGRVGRVGHERDAQGFTGRSSHGAPGGPEWPRAKSLALIPQLYACSLAYGRNVLTGQASPAGQWLVRNVIVWHRPNPAVGALGDKFRPSTSYIVVATRSPKRWFDLTAVRTAHVMGDAKAGATNGPKASTASTDHGRGTYGFTERTTNPAGAPPLDAWFDQDDHDTWTLTTSPSKLAHYAMWPPKLAERLILSMCPERVCTICGEPSRRMETTTLMGEHSRSSAYDCVSKTGGPWTTGLATCGHDGWTDCGHDAWRQGVVLDPFAGTGTTPIVADLHGRDGIGIDLNPANAALVAPRADEVRRSLFGTRPELPGQQDLFAQ